MRLPRFLAFAVLALALAACGGDPVDDSTAEETTTVSQEPAEETTTEEVVVTSDATINARTFTVDNLATCDEIIQGNLIQDITETVPAHQAGDPGSQQDMLDLHVQIQIMVLESEGDLKEALLDLGEPFQTLNEAVYAAQRGGPMTVDLDFTGITADAAAVLEACLDAGYTGAP